MKRALFAAAIALFATDANADMGYPPAKYDIGGETEAEVLQNYRDIFGADANPIIIVPLGQALAACDGIWKERWGLQYPRSEVGPGETLAGCMVRYADFSNPQIVVSNDPNNPELVVRLTRHEIGHLLGWEGTHPR